MTRQDPIDDFLELRKPTLKRQVLLGAQRGLYYSRISKLWLSVSGTRGCIILAYHSAAGDDDARFIDPHNRIAPKDFERQMTFLAKHRRVISMDELAETLDRGEAPPAGSVVLTFDDGYRDNLDVVAPVLESLGLPAVLYLPTGIVERGEAQWADRLYAAFKFRTQSRFHFPELSSGVFDLDRREERRALYGLIGRSVMRADQAARDRILIAVETQLAASEPTPSLTLSWDDLRDMQRRFPSFALGVHTCNHLDLTAMDISVVQGELDRCITDYERELGTSPRHFAYPYSRHDERTRSAVARTSLSTAVTDGHDVLITTGSDPLRMPRIDAPKSMSLLGFYSSGAYPELPRKVLGRS